MKPPLTPQEVEIVVPPKIIPADPVSRIVPSKEPTLALPYRTTNALGRLFKRQASKTWRDLKKAKQRNYRLGEESITDYLVLDFKAQRQHCRAGSFTKNQERANGADWEMWFIQAGLRYKVRLQAKVIEPTRDRYEHLHHHHKDGTTQCDHLIRTAIEENVMPLYCLYSYWESEYDNHETLAGCSLLSPFVVKSYQANNTRDLADLYSFMVPWHCLVCPDGGNQTIAERAHNVATEITKHLPTTTVANDSEAEDLMMRLSRVAPEKIAPEEQDRTLDFVALQYLSSNPHLGFLTVFEGLGETDIGWRREPTRDED